MIVSNVVELVLRAFMNSSAALVPMFFFHFLIAIYCFDCNPATERDHADEEGDPGGEDQVVLVDQPGFDGQK